MMKKTFKVVDELGIHARPASVLVSTAQKFESLIEIASGNKKKDLKSLLGLMTMVIEHDDVITISCEGIDEEAAMNSFLKLLIQEHICVEVNNEND